MEFKEQENPITTNKGPWQQPSVLWTKQNKSFSEEAFQTNQKVLTDIRKHAFTQELIKGNLPEEKNIFFTNQIAHYLTDIARALMHIGSCFEDVAQVRKFQEFSHFVLSSQQQYAKFYSMNYPEKSPTCSAYTSYLLSEALRSKNMDDVAIALATLLPSSWIHKELGKYIRQHQSSNNPYEKWFDLFCDKEFSAIADQSIELVNFIATKVSPQAREKMLFNFSEAAKREYQLVTSAYPLKKNLAPEEPNPQTKVSPQ